MVLPHRGSSNAPYRLTTHAPACQGERMQTGQAPILIARHAETVFNRAARMQGNNSHTPLTRAGFAQAEAMGAALAAHAAATGERPEIWASPAGRARQTASIIAEHLDMSFFDVHADARLREIEVGRWTGRSYADIVAEEGDIFDREHRLFRMPIEGGEHYRDVADRLADWPTGWPGWIAQHRCWRSVMA